MVCIFTISIEILFGCFIGIALLIIGLFTFISEMIEIIKHGADISDFILLFIGATFISLGSLAILCSTGILILV